MANNEKNIPEVSEVIEEIKTANEETLRETIEKWYEQTRTDGMKIGAQYISIGVYAAIQKNLKKVGKSSLNDYRRCIKDIMRIIEVQLKTKQNDSEEETIDDGTTAESSEPNS